MPRNLQGEPKGEGLRIAVALARFNQSVTDRLLAGALEALVAHGVADDAIDVAIVPGAFELPLCAQRLAVTGRYDAIVCLGAVVRGETPHFDFVAGESARGINEVAQRHDVPIAFGVLTTDTIEQALARAGGERGNKGYEAALTALEMVQLLRAVQRFGAVGSRREGRELALQALYQLDMRPDEDPSRGLALFWTHFDGRDQAQEFARELVDGVRGSQERIDTLIRETAQHWRLPRLSRVDLNLLRLAAYELIGRPEIPASVTINEAVEIARRFGGEDSASFVNGVLDAIASAVGTKAPPGSTE